MRVLDTDVCIYLLTGRVPSAAARLDGIAPGDLATTIITAAELRYGALHSARPRRNLERVEGFLGPLVKLPFDAAASFHFARIRTDLSRAGRLIGPMDLLIAAIARATGAILVTNNVSEFSRVESLVIESWMDG